MNIQFISYITEGMLRPPIFDGFVMRKITKTEHGLMITLAQVNGGFNPVANMRR